MRDNFVGLLVTLGLAGVALYLAFASDTAGATMAPGDVIGFDPVTGDPVMTPAPDATDDSPARVAAFLAMIRQFESNNNYGALVGGGTFTDFSQHPNVRKTVRINGVNVTSSAAGAYQFIFSTWSALARRLNLTDFSPASQDAAAVELLREIGALRSIENNEIELALQQASSQWASLPGSLAGQNPKSVQAALDAYSGYLAA